MAFKVYRELRQIGLVTSVPAVLFIGPVVGLLIGRWLDQKFVSAPVFTAIFVFLGFVAAAREVTAILRMISKENEKNEK